VSEVLLITLAGVLVQAGILLATVRFLGQKQEEQHRETQFDLNGLGKKERSIMAELIIQAAITAGLPDASAGEYAVLVRKLINGI
jgi:hypothetical protein